MESREGWKESAFDGANGAVQNGAPLHSGSISLLICLVRRLRIGHNVFCPVS